MDTRETTAAGQVSSSAAEVYEQFFVPALFRQWVEPMLDAVRPAPGDRLLDIGTGTGALARAAVARTGAEGAVLAVDPNDGMLAVAARCCAGVDLRRGVAERLPVGDAEVDCITCQFAVMFFSDRDRGVSEMARVARPDARLAVATWAAVDQSPGYAAMVELLGEHVGDWAAEALQAPFAIGTADELARVLRPRFPGVTVRQHDGEARFRSLDEWLHTDIRGWTLADEIDDRQYGRLRRAAERRLASFVQDDGQVRFSAPALIATATAA